jgi:hypothetical protein
MANKKREMSAIPEEGEILLPAKKPPTPEELDHTTFKSGEYKGYTPSKEAEWNPAYIVALYENVEPKRVSKALYMDCKSEMKTMPKQPRRTAPDYGDDEFELDMLFQHDHNFGQGDD